MSTFLIVFLLLVPLIFGVMFLTMRPTKEEKSVQQRLGMIEKSLLGGAEDVDTDILKQEALSEVPWLNQVLQLLPFSSRLQKLLYQSDSHWTVAKVVFGSLLITACGAWAANFRFPAIPLDLLMGAAAGALPYAYLVFKRGKRMSKFEELLPDAIDLMSRGLKAGHAINSAMEMVSQEVPDPVGTEFRRTFEEQNFGLPMREALLNLARRVPMPDVQFVVTAMLVQRETGGNLAEILDKTTVVIRERFRLRGQLRIYTAQGRMTGMILSALPFGLFLMMDFLNPDYEAILLKDPTGQHILYAGCAMMVVGWYVIRKVIDIKV
jgi:tight adherence protein B